MKRKVLWVIVIGALIMLLIMGVDQYIEFRNRQTDPNWQIANKIYKLENALKEVYEDYECQSVSNVIPFTYTDSERNTIGYYCCQTAYVSNESGEYTGLDMNAIGLVIDLSQIENKRECTVNGYDASQCEIDDCTYLCWTLSPEISCVIDYDADTVKLRQYYSNGRKCAATCGVKYSGTGS